MKLIHARERNVEVIHAILVGMLNSRIRLCRHLLRSPELRNREVPKAVKGMWRQRALMDVKHSDWSFEESYDEQEVASKFDPSARTAIQKNCRVREIK